MTTPAVAAVLGEIHPPAEVLAAAAHAHWDRLTKPRGALGRLETLGARLAVIAGRVPPPVPAAPAVAVFAGDHGVVAEGVTPWPQEVTAQMVAGFCAGGAAVNVVARRCGASLAVVDVGVASRPAPHPLLIERNVRRGTANLAKEAAMTGQEAEAAVLVGAEVAAKLVADGADLLVGGEMGIGNTTPSVAVIAALTGGPVEALTGRGTGIDDATLQRKAAVIARALRRSGPPDNPLDLLAEVGGLEIAALAGFYLGAARARLPVLIDGVIALAGACLAVALAPPTAAYLIAGHRSSEPAATAALDWLGLEPLLDLELRLGEGSGAVLAVPLVVATAALMAEMATFHDAGIDDATTADPATTGG